MPPKLEEVDRRLRAVGTAVETAAPGELLGADTRPLGIVVVIVDNRNALSSRTVTLFDGSTRIGAWVVPAATTEVIISPSAPLSLAGNLNAQASGSDVYASAWARDL